MKEASMRAAVGDISRTLAAADRRALGRVGGEGGGAGLAALHGPPAPLAVLEYAEADERRISDGIWETLLADATLDISRVLGSSPP